MNAWAICCLVPLVTSSPLSLGVIPAVSAPLLVLALGAAALGRRPRWSMGLLLTGYPTAVALVVAAIPGWTIAEPYPASMLVVAALAALAYGGGATAATSRLSFGTELTTRPLQPIAKGDRRSSTVRRLVLATGAIGALGVAIIAPTAGGRVALRAAWGDASDAAALLSAVVGGAIATVSVAAILGPVTRQKKLLHTASQRRTRVAMLLLVVGSGLVVWQLLRHAAER